MERLGNEYPDQCPVEFLFSVFTSEAQDVNDRITAAKEAARFLYPMRKAVDMNLGEQGTLKMTWGKPHKNAAN